MGPRIITNTCKSMVFFTIFREIGKLYNVQVEDDDFWIEKLSNDQDKNNNHISNRII